MSPSLEVSPFSSSVPPCPLLWAWWEEGHVPSVCGCCSHFKDSCEDHLVLPALVASVGFFFPSFLTKLIYSYCQLLRSYVALLEFYYL